MEDQMLPGLTDVTPPPMFRVRQTFPRPTVEDVEQAVAEQISRPEVLQSLEGVTSIALAVGSRGIAGIDRITAAAVRALRAAGTEPFIVPSMGSHGGATGEGQRAILAHLGITEEAVDAPIRSSMETIRVGTVTSANGNEVPLHMDALAAEADAIVPVNRVKPHTGFKGPVESGLCKMLTIGLGKHEGAATLHREGYRAFDSLILDAGREIVGTGRVPFGLAVVENAYEETAIVEALVAEGLVEGEQRLLDQARALMPGFGVEHIDVLVVERFGKDISGVGMDANITGRGELAEPLPGFAGAWIERIVVLGLTEASGGNAHGIGLADIITRRLHDQLDLQTTWINSLTAGSLACGRIPPAVEGDDRAVMAAASALPGVKPQDARIVRIRDTLSLTDIAVSENLVDEFAASGAEVGGPWDGTWEQVR